jgi:hypothetical protein
MAREAMQAKVVEGKILEWEDENKDYQVSS